MKYRIVEVLKQYPDGETRSNYVVQYQVLGLWWDEHSVHATIEAAKREMYRVDYKESRRVVA